MFACLISKLLCNNIYQSSDVRDEKRASLELKHRLDRPGKPFENAGQENYLLCVYPDFSSEISLVISGIISLHDWFTFAAVAADKNCIDNTL